MSSSTFACSVCSSTFKYKKSLSRHLKSHQNVSEPITPKGSKCGLCGSMFQGQWQLCDHLHAHSIHAIVSTVEFEDIIAFENWRDSIEKEGKFRLVKKYSTTSRSLETEHFVCHRTGHFQSKSRGIRAPKALTTNKVGFTCSAFANVKKSLYNGRVSVDYCLTHYAHDDLVQRLAIGKERQRHIVQMLENGLDTEKIIELERGDIVVDDDGQFELQRHNLVSKDDVNFIRTKFGLKPGQKDADDHVSVALWMEELKQKGDLLCYRSDTEIFYIGIQTEFQRTALKRNGSNTICIDSTHGTNRGGHLLVTLLVVDDAGKGLPVAWFITDSEREQNLLPFFEAIRKRVGSLTPKYFMSDDFPGYFNGWKRMFDTSGTQKLLCAWHVRSNWAKNITAKLKFKDTNTAKFQKRFVNCYLKSLANDPDRQSFENKLDMFLGLLRIMDQTDFESYFRTYYCSVERQREWASWARKSSVVNTNMFIEAYHRKLKYSSAYLNKRCTSRLDYLLFTLTKLAVDYHKRYLIDVHTMLPPSYRLNVMNDRHRKSTNLNGDDVSVILTDKEWLVKAQLLTNAFYTVRLQDHRGCTCLLKCRYCHVCPFAYSCTCTDAQLTKTACKHFHFIHSRFFSPSTPAVSTIFKTTPTFIPQDPLKDDRKFDYDSKLEDVVRKLKSSETARRNVLVGKHVIRLLEDAANYASYHGPALRTSAKSAVKGSTQMIKRRVERQLRFNARKKKFASDNDYHEQLIASKAIRDAVKKFEFLKQK